METLKSLSIHKQGPNVELSVQLSGGAAAVTLSHGMSDAQVIQQLQCLAHLIEESARERAETKYQLNLLDV